MAVRDRQDQSRHALFSSDPIHPVCHDRPYRQDVDYYGLPCAHPYESYVLNHVQAERHWLMIGIIVRQQ